MSIAGSDGNLRALGSELAAFIVARSDEQLTTASLQAVIGDLAVDHPDLVAPLKDLVSRQSFRSVIPHATSRGGAIQRDALIQEISRIYHPAILTAIENVLNGFLETSGGVTSQLSQSIFTQDQSPICQALDDNAGVYSKPQITSSPLKSDNNELQLLSASQSYFAAAIELAKKLCGVDLATRLLPILLAKDFLITYYVMPLAKTLQEYLLQCWTPSYDQQILLSPLRLGRSIR